MYCQKCCTHSTSWHIYHASIVGYIKGACKGVSLMVCYSYRVSRKNDHSMSAFVSSAFWVQRGKNMLIISGLQEFELRSC
jgi:hypothetical protein